MKKIVLITGLLFITACSSTKIVVSWKNQEITSFEPKNILVVGMTNNLKVRKIFEEELKKAFLLRNINTVKSTTIFDETFTHSEKNEEEIRKMIKKLSSDGFDTILITSVKGVDEKQNYPIDYYTIDFLIKRFGNYYYKFQEIYYTPLYYEVYRIYHVEASIYKINEKENKSLIWVGAIDVKPKTVESTVKEYVASIIKQLEREKLINKL